MTRVGECALGNQDGAQKEEFPLHGGLEAFTGRTDSQGTGSNEVSMHQSATNVAETQMHPHSVIKGDVCNVLNLKPGNLCVQGKSAIAY